MSELQHGCYTEKLPFPCERLSYMAGGHPGCGGYIEALKLTLSGEKKFVLQEYRDDCDGQRYRHKEYNTIDDLLGAAKDWRSLNKNPWVDTPFWMKPNA